MISKKPKFGKNFWLIFLPFHLLAIIGLWYVADYFWTLLLFWFVIGVIGNGVAAHRYFAHGQFQTSMPIRWILGFLSTLGAIGPIHHWVIQHKTHHLRADKDKDPHNPAKGIWHTFYAWSFLHGSDHIEKEYFRERFQKRLTLNMARDSFYMFFYRYHYYIIWTFSSILFAINPILVCVYAMAYCIDFFRLGLINYCCHRYGYRNHDTNDLSTNNVIIGLITFGFGWHNNHHANPGKLILTERWWEIDIEGYIGYLFSKLR